MKMFPNRYGQRGQRAPNPYRQNFQFTPMSQPSPFEPSYVRQPRMQRAYRAPRFQGIERTLQRRTPQYRPPKRDYSSDSELATQAAQIATQAYQQGVEHTFQMMAKQTNRPILPQNQRPFQPRLQRNISHNYQKPQSYRPIRQNDQRPRQDPNGQIESLKKRVEDLSQQMQRQNIRQDGDAPMPEAPLMVGN